MIFRIFILPGAPKLLGQGLGRQVQGLLTGDPEASALKQRCRRDVGIKAAQILLMLETSLGRLLNLS